MKLHILTGRAGSGKTTAILRCMREEGKARPQLLIVPEQASFETERRFCQENGNQAGRYGEVLSFTRLESRVISLAGGGADTVLDDSGRLLVMYGALKAVSGNLTAYAMPSRRPEFLSSLLRTAEELKSCCISPADLAKVGEETEGLDGEKLRDLGLIFGAYQAMTARGTLDPGDRLSRLAKKLRHYPFLAGKDVYLDGFTDFTPQQIVVLEQMLRQAHSLTLTLTCDSGGEEIFAPMQKTAARMNRLAAKLGCPVLAEHLTGEGSIRTKPLAALERRLFSEPVLPYEGEWDGSIRIADLPTPSEEVRRVAGEIRRLSREEGVAWRDIAVSARTMERYGELIERIFEEYHIPVFFSVQTDLLQKPVFTLITAAMDAVNSGYLYEDMFRYLKTGLAGLSPEECDTLENYVLTWDLRGSRWTASKGWTMHPDGYHQKFTEETEKVLEELNALRLRVIEPLEALRKSGGTTVGEQVLSLYEFLEQIGAPERLEERRNALLERGEPELAEEYRQLWEIFCRSLEQCYGMLGETEADFGEFSHLLKLLLSRCTVGTIPASLDRVTVGDAQRLSNRTCKVLFLLGADDGQIPHIAAEQGLLTDRDREILEDFGLTLSPQAEERLLRENTIVYTICTRPSEKLYVTWPLTGEGGGEKRPSFLVTRLKALFPAGVAEIAAEPSPAELTFMAAFSPEVRQALGEDCEKLFRRIDAAKHWKRGRLSAGTVSKLYGKKVAMSASRMDQYQSCHFAYFLRYGLGAENRRPAGFSAPEYGTFIHFVLEYVLKRVKEAGGIGEVSKEAVADLTQEAVSLYVRTTLGGMENQTPRFRYLFRRLQKNVLAVVENVTEELRNSDFQPIFFELGFGYGGALPPVEIKKHGVTVSVSGFVDRVDGWEKDGRLYLRVVDYKTGRKSFDLTEIWNGLGLQMLLYLFTLEEKGEKLLGTPPLPAGVLYLPARDAMVTGSRNMAEAERQAQVDKALTRRGVILQDHDVICAMEHPDSKMRFLPLRVSKSTGAITGEALVTAERLGRLKRHTEHILEKICGEIASGNISADPFWRNASRNACQYCPYAAACQFEEGRDRRHFIPSVRNGEFWKFLENTEEGGDQNGREANG